MAIFPNQNKSGPPPHLAYSFPYKSINSQPLPQPLPLLFRGSDLCAPHPLYALLPILLCSLPLLTTLYSPMRPFSYPSLPSPSLPLPFPFPPLPFLSLPFPSLPSLTLPSLPFPSLPSPSLPSLPFPPFPSLPSLPSLTLPFPPLPFPPLLFHTFPNCPCHFPEVLSSQNNALPAPQPSPIITPHSSQGSHHCAQHVHVGSKLHVN